MEACEFCGLDHTPTFRTAFKRNELRKGRDAEIAACASEETEQYIRSEYAKFCIPFDEAIGYREDEINDPYKHLLGRWA